MKSFALAVAVQLLFLLAKGIDVQDSGKRVVCIYEPGITEENRTLLPEDIDASLCTHLISFGARISEETGKIIFRANGQFDEIDFIKRVLKLKENNPELKVLLNFKFSYSNQLKTMKSERTTLINKLIEFLISNGFDGVLIDVNEDDIGEFLCEMRAEFDKKGFVLTTCIPPIGVDVEIDQDFYNKNRCYNFFLDSMLLKETFEANVTSLSSPLPSVKMIINDYLAKGIPANKLVITISTFGAIIKLKYLNETGIGAEIVDPRRGHKMPLPYNEMVEKINDPSEQWTIRRDEASNSPYGFNIHGQWASYDDTSSVATKAQYVVQNQLGGAAILMLDFDDFMGIGGEGKFPLTRKLHDIIIGGKENKTHSSVQ